VGVALMQEYGLARLDGEIQLRDERTALCRTRREVAMVIETALADCHGLGIAQELPQFIAARGDEAGRVVWMHARGCRQRIGARTRELETWCMTPAARARDITVSRSASKL
jgi:hypothetical protein